MADGYLSNIGEGSKLSGGKKRLCNKRGCQGRDYFIDEGTIGLTKPGSCGYRNGFDPADDTTVIMIAHGTSRHRFDRVLRLRKERSLKELRKLDGWQVL